jgi:hypothetical protein
LLIVSGARTRVVIRRANNLMCESLDTGGRADAVGFFCECGDADCFEQVWLTPEAYDAARTDAAWSALASGHEPVDDDAAA